MKMRQPTLKRLLIMQPLIVQFFTLVLGFAILTALLLRLDSGGAITQEDFASVVASSVERTSDGELAIRPTSALRQIQRDTPDLWFVAADSDGRTVSYGQIPTQYASLIPALNQLSYAQMRARSSPYVLSAAIRRVHGPAGELTLLGHGKITAMTLTVVLATNAVALPVFIVLALVTLVTTPWVVRRSLAGVAKVSDEAAQIDVDRRGIRLTETEIPHEIAPLVRAVNAALSRLDDGYARQQRFIAAAAHELRTPVAILRVKVEAADGDTQRAFQSDIARLSNLAEQLLDLHRLEDEQSTGSVDLAALVRNAVADLAPLLIASGKSIEVETSSSKPLVGNSGAIERVITNLVHNAAEHGGAHIVVRVSGTTLEVEDDGPGIPVEEREHVFEPFHRLRPRQTGIGLGLNLVQEVMHRHDGTVSIVDAPAGGTIVRASFRAYANFRNAQRSGNVGLLL